MVEEEEEEQEPLEEHMVGQGVPEECKFGREVPEEHRKAGRELAVGIRSWGQFGIQTKQTGLALGKQWELVEHM